MEQIKFQLHPQDFPYCLSFDLAKFHTGWSFCLMQGEQVSVKETGVIDMTDVSEEIFWLEYYHRLSKVFTQFLAYKEKMLVTKERMPMQNGYRSSIAALQALAQCHAIFDLIIAEFGMIVYDMVGVPAISEKALFRHLTGKDKVEKTDIRDYILSNTSNRLQENVSLDISDSIAVAFTLYFHTANQDIKKRIAELKKAKNKRISAKKVSSIEQEQESLRALLRGEYIDGNDE